MTGSRGERSIGDQLVEQGHEDIQINVGRMISIVFSVKLTIASLVSGWTSAPTENHGKVCQMSSCRI